MPLAGNSTSRFQQCKDIGLVPSNRTRRVFDAFMLSREHLIVKLRVLELQHVVHKFLMVEGDKTFTGLTHFSEFPVVCFAYLLIVHVRLYLTMCD